jgi:hypothetical protein
VLSWRKNIYYIWQPIDASAEPLRPPTVWTYWPNVQSLVMRTRADRNDDVAVAAQGFIALVTAKMNGSPVTLPLGVTCASGFDLRNMFACNSRFFIYVYSSHLFMAFLIMYCLQ